MKAALPGIAAPNLALPGVALGAAWPGAVPAASPPSTGTGGCFSSRLLLEEQPGLRSWPLPFQRLPALGAS